MEDWSLLRIFGRSWSRGSARATESQVERLSSGEVRQTVNGVSVALDSGIDLFQLTAANSEAIQAPPLSDLRLGAEGIVESPKEECEFLAGGSTEITICRDPVAGSVRAEDALGNALEVSDVDGRDITLAANASGAYVFFRPSMTMIVSSPLSCQFVQHTKRYSWSITLVEKTSGGG